MVITNVRVRLIKNENIKLKGLASIVFDDCFAVHDIKIIEGKEDFFVVMPSRKSPSGEFKDIAHPLNSELREYIISTILEAFYSLKLSQINSD